MIEKKTYFDMCGDMDKLHEEHADIVSSEGICEKTNKIIQQIQEQSRVEWVRVDDVIEKDKTLLLFISALIDDEDILKDISNMNNDLFPYKLSQSSPTDAEHSARGLIDSVGRDTFKKGDE